MKKNTKIALVVLGLVLGIVVLVILFTRGAGNPSPDKTINSVTVQKDGNALTVSSDGSVRYEKDGLLYEDFWDSGKVKTFFDYIDASYTGESQVVSGGQNYISINSGGGSSTYIFDEDELIDIIEDETTGDDDGGDTGGGGGGGSTSTSTPSPTSTGASGGGGGSSECLYWRLSYCVRPRTSTPSPTSTPVTVEIREPNCEDNTQTGKTVIGNELCLPTPTPTP